MAKISDIEITKLLFDEGAAPSTPASTNVALYAKADGLLYSKDDAGTESSVSTSGGYPTFSGVSLTKSATQALTQSTSTAVTFDGEDFDTNTYHDNATNNARITVPATGYYLFGASMSMLGMADQTIAIIRFRVDGTTVQGGRAQAAASGTGNVSPTFSKVISLTSGQYVEMMGEHNDAAADVRESSNGTSFWAYRVG